MPFGCAAKQAGNQPECSTARFRQIKRAGHVAKDGSGSAGGGGRRIAATHRPGDEVDVDHGGREVPHPSRSAPFRPLLPTGVSFWFVSCEQRSSGLPLPIRGNKLPAGQALRLSNMPPSGNSKSVLGANFQPAKRYTAPRRQRPSPIPLAFPLCGRGSVPVLATSNPYSRATTVRVPRVPQ